MTPKKIHILGMELDSWQYGSCTAHFGVGDTWATLYTIESKEPGRGHAKRLLKAAMRFYKGKRFGGTVALNPVMRKLYQKLGIQEYK